MPKYLKQLSKYLVPLLILSLFTKTVIFSALVQPFEFPDEQAHFASVNFFTNENRMPQGMETDLSKEIKQTEIFLGTFRDKYGNNEYTYHQNNRLAYTNGQTGKYEKQIKALNASPNKTEYVGVEAARYPFLYYLYGSVFYRTFYNANVLTRLFVLRISNVLFFLGTITVAYLMGLEIFKKKSYAIALLSLVGLQPLLTFVGAGVNSDNLHIFLFSLITYFCIRLISKGWSKYLSFFLALAFSLDLMTKPQAYIAIPVTGTALILRFLVDRNPKKYFIEISKIVIFTAIISGWYFLPQILKSGGVIGFSPKGNISNLSFIQFTKFSINKFYSQNIVWYWGVFKWLGVVLPKPLWWISNRIVGVAIIGILVCCVKLIKNYKKNNTELNVLIFLILTIVFYIISIFWYDWDFTKNFGYSFGVQARYYLPLIIAQMAILEIGIVSLIPRPFEIIKKLALIFLVGWFALLNIAALLTILSSYYSFLNLQTFILQVSQYKPAFAKGEWVVFWLLVYAISIIVIVFSDVYVIVKSEKIKT